MPLYAFGRRSELSTNRACPRAEWSRPWPWSRRRRSSPASVLRRRGRCRRGHEGLVGGDPRRRRPAARRPGPRRRGRRDGQPSRPGRRPGAHHRAGRDGPGAGDERRAAAAAVGVQRGQLRVGVEVSTGAGVNGRGRRHRRARLRTRISPVRSCPGIDLAADAGERTTRRTTARSTRPVTARTSPASSPRTRTTESGSPARRPASKIMPVRVLDASGSGSSSDVAEGIIWAADHGARVINLSLGGGPSPGMQIAMQYARSKQVVTFAAAGNAYQDGNQPTYPAAYPEAVAVAAIDQSLAPRARSRTPGSYVDIAAPGDSIWSTYGQGRDAVRADERNVDGDAVRDRDRRARARREPEARARPSSSTRSRRRRDRSRRARARQHLRLRPHQPAAARCSRRRRRRSTGAPRVTATGSSSADGQVRAYGGARSYGDLSRPRTLRADRRRGPHARRPGLLARRRRRRGVLVRRRAVPRRSAGPEAQLADRRHGGDRRAGMGYILLGRDGGVFTFGDAHFYGSTGGMRLNAPVLDMTMTANGHGLLVRRGRRRRVLVRRRAVPRLDRRDEVVASRCVR